MATIEEYGSGRILRSIRLAHLALRCTVLPLAGPVIRKKLELRMKPVAIRPISPDEAARIIRECRCCAAGSRICQPLFPDAVSTEAVFLDDLAERLVQVHEARPVTADHALEVLGKYPDNPLLLSKVSGQYLEICRSVPDVCIYWKMRRNGMDV